MKIQQHNVGDKYELSLVVLNSALKTTKGGKPYLFLEVSDGSDTITGNVWDWAHTNKPERNTILNLTGIITEYNGAKQLKIDSISRNDTLDVSAFAPNGDINIDQYHADALYLIDGMANEVLRDLTKAIFTDHINLFKVVPGAKKVHHACVGGTLAHSVDTARKAAAIAMLTPNCNVDLCLAGGLLHDIGKLWTYSLDGIAIDFTFNGHVFDHIVIGITKLEYYRNDNNANIIMLLQHIIASHHGKLEYGSPVTPRFIEAWIVNYADGVDATCQTILELNKKATTEYTDKEWSLENRQMITQAKIRELIGG